MPAPVAAARTTPSVGGTNAIMLENGHPTKVILSAIPNIALEEVEVTPMGFEGGEPINTASMFNILYITKAPRHLIEVTDISMVVNYDPGVYADIVARLNKPDTATVQIPDGTTHAAFAYLRSFKPQRNAEGTQPKADVVIVITNRDPASHGEFGPVTVNVPGT